MPSAMNISIEFYADSFGFPTQPAVIHMPIRHPWFFWRRTTTPIVGPLNLDGTGWYTAKIKTEGDTTHVTLLHPIRDPENEAFLHQIWRRAKWKRDAGAPP